MASSAAIMKLVEEDFVQVCQKENHGGRLRRVFGLNSYETMCTRGISDDVDTIKVVKISKHNAVWVDESTKYVNCSLIQTLDIEGRMLIHLKENHEGNICEFGNYCSLACKLKRTVKKKRTNGRIRADLTIFHRFSMMMITRKARTGGRRRRAYMVPEGHLPSQEEEQRWIILCAFADHGGVNHLDLPPKKEQQSKPV